MEFDRLRILLLSLSVVLLSPAVADDGVHIAYSETLSGISFDQRASEGQSKPSSGMVRNLRFQAFSQEFDFRLDENHALLGNEELRAISSKIGVYRGELNNIPGSWARFVIADGQLQGMFSNGEEVFAIESGAEQTSPIIFRLDDLSIAPHMLSCSHSSAGKSATSMLQAITNDFRSEAAQGPGASTQIQVAIIGDFEFTSDKGASAEADLITRMNNVDGIFSEQVGVQLTIGRIDTYPDDNDPFSETLDSAVFLPEVRDYRDATPEQHANGLTHVFTGRDFDGSTVGRAYTGAVCSRRFGAGVTQGTFSATTDSLIAAHELGHNFNAPHDGDADRACPDEPETFLMSPSINGSDQFSACSINVMQAAAASASCITPLASTDVGVVADVQASNELLGNSTTVTFTVSNAGTESVADVNIEVVVPPVVTLDSIESSVGTCSSGANNVSCDLGSLSSGSGASITLDVTTITTGIAAFSANVNAATDENSNNDSASAQFTVDPAVDLIAEAADATQAFLNQLTTVVLVVDNDSVLAASDAVVTVTPSAGLVIDSATWSAGNCSVNSGTLTCEAANVAARSSTAVAMQINGVTEGDYSYSMSVSSSDADRNPANNEAMGAIVVPANTAPTLSITAPSDGGSFSAGSAVRLTVNASDLEDGDIGSSVTWSSNVDGSLGSGASLSVTTLSLGAHAITASVSDSSNVEVNASATLTITEPPPVAESSGGGGGGSMGLLMLLTLVSVRLWRPLRRRFV